MKTKEIRVKPLEPQAADAVSVVEQIRKRFRWKGEFDSWSETDNSWCLGFEFSKIKKRPRQIVTGAGWFGFEGDPTGGFRRSVWLYGVNDRKIKQVRSHLKRFIGKSISVEPEDEGDKRHLIITEPKSKAKDYEWFAKILRGLGIPEEKIASC